MDTQIIVEGKRRRVWPEGLKRQIVEESNAPGVSVCDVARRYDLDPAQLYQWRKKFRKANIGCPPSYSGEGFFAVDVVREAVGGEDLNGGHGTDQPTLASRVVIAFPNGRQLYVPASLERKYLDVLIAAVAGS